MNKLLSIALVAILTAMAAGCDSGLKWNVNGSIEGADSKTMILQASDNGRWYTLDSITTDKSGNFKYSHDPIGYPDIFRLVLDGKSIYFPIDSVETVNITSTADAFDSDYELSGSTAAEMLMAVDNRIRNSASVNGKTSVANDSVLKRELAGMLLGDPAGIVSYYIICKKVNGQYLFDPANPRDNRIVGAVANAFDQFRPNDPRTRYLRQVFLANRQLVSPAGIDTMLVNEIKLFDITLTDNKGKPHNLEEVTKNNKVVVLNFTIYSAEGSPAFNLDLAKVYEKRHNQGLEIYQVAVDNDEFQWKQSARNLPWITVYNPPSTGSQILLNYNVSTLPSTYIIANGELVERVDDITKLDSAVAPYL